MPFKKIDVDKIIHDTLDADPELKDLWIADQQSKIAMTEIADLLEVMQSMKNDGNGIDCIRTVVGFLRENDYERAKTVVKDQWDYIITFQDIAILLSRLNQNDAKLGGHAFDFDGDPIAHIEIKKDVKTVPSNFFAMKYTHEEMARILEAIGRIYPYEVHLDTTFPDKVRTDIMKCESDWEAILPRFDWLRKEFTRWVDDDENRKKGWNATPAIYIAELKDHILKEFINEHLYYKQPQ
jgi:hypothetical protein